MKKIIAMLLACMMVIGLAACGGNADTTTAANDQPAGPEAVTLKVWAPQEDQADDKCWLPLMEAAFAAAHRCRNRYPLFRSLGQRFQDRKPRHGRLLRALGDCIG